MANPVASFSGSVEGVWFIPSISGVVQDARKVYVASDATPLVMPSMAQLYDPPSRSTKIGVLRKAKQYEGSVAGDLAPAFSLTATQWAERLMTLHRDQGQFVIQVITPHFVFNEVILDDGFSITPYVSATPMFSVSIPFISIET